MMISFKSFKSIHLKKKFISVISSSVDYIIIKNIIIRIKMINLFWIIRYKKNILVKGTKIFFFVKVLAMVLINCLKKRLLKLSQEGVSLKNCWARWNF